MIGFNRPFPSPPGGFKRYQPLLILACLLVVLGITSPVFFTQQNIWNLLRQLSPLILVAIGMLLVIQTGGIDFAAGSIEAFGGIAVSILIVYGNLTVPLGCVLAVVLALLGGFVLGAISGFLVSYCRIEPFIATIAMMTIARGLTYLLSGGQTVRLTESSFAGRALLTFGIGNTRLAGIPYVVVATLLVVGAIALMQRFTRFGRMLPAAGADEMALRFAGINAAFYKGAAYAIAGLLYAAAGIIVTARAATGTPAIGANMEIDAITAVILGGASLSGGSGSVIHVMFGALIWGLLQTTMNLLSVAAYPQQVIKGVIIIFAVMLQRQRRHRDS